MVKPWWQSKVLWLSVLMILGGIAEYIANLPPGVSIATIIAGVISLILRLFPTTPIAGTPGAKARKQ